MSKTEVMVSLSQWAVVLNFALCVSSHLLFLEINVHTYVMMYPLKKRCIKMFYFRVCLRVAMNHTHVLRLWVSGGLLFMVLSLPHAFIHNGLNIAQTLCNQSFPFSRWLAFLGHKSELCKRYRLLLCLVVLQGWHVFVFWWGALRRFRYLLLSHSRFWSTRLYIYLNALIHSSMFWEVVTVCNMWMLMFPSSLWCWSKAELDLELCASAEKTITGEAMNEIFK